MQLSVSMLRMHCHWPLPVCSNRVCKDCKLWRASVCTFRKSRSGQWLNQRSILVGLLAYHGVCPTTFQYSHRPSESEREKGTILQCHWLTSNTPDAITFTSCEHKTHLAYGSPNFDSTMNPRTRVPRTT